jgi:hypothetical protein
MGKMTFNGRSQELKQTQVVPTLTSPIKNGHNVVWCASFLSAWKSLQKSIAGEPVRLENADEHCMPLNEANDPKNSLPPGALYAVAGWVQKGVVETIHETVKKMFPAKKPPLFPGISDNSFLAYAYLEANVSFKLPYFQNKEPLTFTGSDGSKMEINSFGIRAEDDLADYALRDQPAILFTKRNAEYELQEFVVDLCRDSEPSQIILACIEPQKTLMDTISNVQQKIEEAENHEGLEENDVLLVPDLFWQLEHDFDEFEGRSFKNKTLQGQRLDVARQDILFRLDRSGAELKSEAKLYALSIPTHFLFDRPFLIYMKKRDVKIPYFAMWVSNGELLTPWNGKQKSHREKEQRNKSGS